MFASQLRSAIPVKCKQILTHGLVLWSRRPFLASGCIPYCICLLLLVSPGLLTTTNWARNNLIDYMSSGALEVWFGIFYIAFFLMTTFTQIPYDALGPELTDNPDDRSRVFFFCTIFDGLGALVAVILPVMLPSYVNIYRSKSDDEIFYSCNNPENGSIGLDSTAVNPADGSNYRCGNYLSPAQVSISVELARTFALPGENASALTSLCAVPSPRKILVNSNQSHRSKLDPRSAAL